MDGQGTFLFSDGRIYQGEWRDDQMNGYGQLEYSKSKKYTGGFVNGLF